MTRKDLETASGILEWAQKAPRCCVCSETGHFHNRRRTGCDHEFVPDGSDNGTAEWLAECVRLRAVVEDLLAPVGEFYAPDIMTSYEYDAALRAAMRKEKP